MCLPVKREFLLPTAAKCLLIGCFYNYFFTTFSSIILHPSYVYLSCHLKCCCLWYCTVVVISHLCIVAKVVCDPGVVNIKTNVVALPSACFTCLLCINLTFNSRSTETYFIKTLFLLLLRHLLLLLLPLVSHTQRLHRDFFLFALSFPLLSSYVVL